ncbi:release factor glutamine methyltransferase [Clostridia bacterium]|nr:release factor glutamine methyltransferase [Clostridia bacterium]
MTITTGKPIRDALRDGIVELRNAGIPDAEADAGWMLEQIAEFPRMLLAINREPLTERQLKLYARMLNLRKQRMPLQYLLGEVPFAGVKIEVEPGVLIPRPETELVFKSCAAFLNEQLDRPDLLKFPEMPKSLKRSGCLRVLDLCCGSGALAVALAKKFKKNVDVFALDITDEACAKTVHNAHENGVIVKCFHGNLLDGLACRDFFDGFFHAIVCNPPYIPTGEIDSLQPEVLKEPRIALDGGPDGLDFYRRIALHVEKVLDPRGGLFLEVGAGQAEAVRELLEPHFGTIYVEDDWNDIPRVVSAMNPRGK